MPDCGFQFAVRRYEADCRGKEPFADPSLAAKVLRRMRRKRRPVTTYRCPHCGKWHIGGGQGRGR